MDVGRLVDTMTEQEQTQLACFLADRRGRAIALARSSRERAMAVHDWLNGIEDPDAWPGGEDGGPRTAGVDQAPSRLLPAAAALPAVGLEVVLRARRSGYAFSPDPLPLSTLSDLLWHAAGLGRRVEKYGRPDHPIGVAPTAGGLDSVAIHVWASHVESLDAGHYVFERDDHALAPRRLGATRVDLRRMYGQREFAELTATTLVLCARLGHGLQKYTLRHYRTLHVDVGIAVQNLYLVATALGLSCCAVAGFCDRTVADTLAADEDHLPIMMFALGCAAA